MAAVEQREVRRWDECGSDYFAASSYIARLCPECGHRLYTHQPCGHGFAGGRRSRSVAFAPRDYSCACLATCHLRFMGTALTASFARFRYILRLHCLREAARIIFNRER